MNRVFRARDFRLTLGERTLVMGIVNVTPDSFSDGGEAFDPRAAIERALKFESEGADILDIGGMSSRPGSEPVSVEEELRRVRPVIKGLRGKTKLPISVDTYRAEVARQSFASGASIINDISAGNFDIEMPRVAAEFGAGVVLMHIKGTPRDMQQNPYYDDVVTEVRDYLEAAVANFTAAGLQRESLLVDPGIGFGKAHEHNLQLIANLRRFQGVGAGVLLGASRKSFIGTLTGRPVTDRISGSLAAAVVGAMNGADIVRVHDVAATIDALKVSDPIRLKTQNPKPKT